VKAGLIALATLAVLVAVAAASPAHASTGTRRAPSRPPLTSGGTETAGAAGAEDGAGGSPQGEADPLVSNGLGSPTCKGALASELSATNRRNCETSGFAVAPAPTGDYGIDVHIDTGALGLGSEAVPSIIQDLLVTPLWMALVWAVHALVVMLEWCFTIDLLDSAGAGVGRGLRQMQAAFTQPWLPIVLAVASVLALYHGLIRRRVAETVGEALLMGAMMAGGIWVITDPTGTVGALGEWANQASLGTLAVAASGTPTGPGRALGSSLDTVFAAAIEVPWCYLEFGDVGWCREPARLDPRLRAAALKIAAGEAALAACAPSSAPLAPCAAAGSAQAKALEHSAELLRDARSNGAIFLALPANGPARNSINEQGSLLRTICQSSEATSCRGPTAAQAEFRTGGHTWARVGGLLLIAGGLLGMMLLLGFVALRLLAAAIFSLLYLLLAPAMVLAPAFGESGRALFRRWAARLLGAVVSKLVFSFLLGVVLAVLAVISNLAAIGWWTQWLLMSAFWWGAYARRHQALGAAEGALADRRSASERAGQRSVVRRMSDVLESRKGMAVARWAKGRRDRRAPSVEERRRLAQVTDRRSASERARAGTDEQVRRTLEHEHREASAQAQAAPEIQQRLSAKRAQLERVRRERGAALVGGNRRRAARLGHRGQRIQGEIEREQEALGTARATVSDGEQALRRTGKPYTSERQEERDRFLDAQAALPSARARDRSGARGAHSPQGWVSPEDWVSDGWVGDTATGSQTGRRNRVLADDRAGAGAARSPTAERGGRTGERRDYAALAGLAGYGREEYERLDPRSQRAARLGVDRELALRNELNETARTVAERSRLDSRLEAGRSDPGSRGGRWPISDRSSVMRDAREVAAGRKRQLGRNRP
jgi:hypothetical protein